MFVRVGDPVGSGFVASLAHPGGNITGFAGYDGTMGGKWLEVLKETAPQVTRVLTIFNPRPRASGSLAFDAEFSAAAWASKRHPAQSTMRPKSNVSFPPSRRRRTAALLSFRMPTSVTTSSSPWRCGIDCPRSSPTLVPSRLAGSSPTLTTWRILSGEWQSTLIGFFVVRSRAIFPCSSPPNSISSSTSRPPRHSA